MPIRTVSDRGSRGLGIMQSLFSFSWSCCLEGNVSPVLPDLLLFQEKPETPTFMWNLFWEVGNKLKGKKTYCGSQIKHSCGPDLTYQPPVCNLSSRSTWLTQFMCGNSWNGPQIHWHNSYHNCNTTLKLDKLTYVPSTVNKH